MVESVRHALHAERVAQVQARDKRPDVIERVLNHTLAKIARTYNHAADDAEKRQALAILGDLIEAAGRGEEERSNVLHFA